MRLLIATMVAMRTVNFWNWTVTDEVTGKRRRDAVSDD